MEYVQLKRRLTAVLLADVVGYSRLMSVDEDGTHLRLADCIKRLIEPTVCAYRGHAARSKGDGLLVEFDSAVDAVRCAVEIQHRLAEAAADGDRDLELRIGINAGDVIVDEHDVYGNSVNIGFCGSRDWQNQVEYMLPRPFVTNCSGTLTLVFSASVNGGSRIFDRLIGVYRVIGEQGKKARNPSGSRVLVSITSPVERFILATAAPS